MQFGCVEKIFKLAELNIDIGMDEHSENSIQHCFYGHHRRIGAQDNYWRKFNSLIDDDLCNMRTRARKKINLLARVMGLMRTPQKLTCMLQAMEKVYIQIVCHHKN